MPYLYAMKKHKLTKKQALTIRLYVIKNDITLSKLASDSGIEWSSQMTNYLNGVPMPKEKFDNLKQIVKF